MLPVEELGPNEDEPAAAVGAGKTLERTPEFGAVESPFEEEGSVTETVPDELGEAAEETDDVVFASITSVEAEPSDLPANALLGAASPLALLACVWPEFGAE